MKHLWLALFCLWSSCVLAKGEVNIYNWSNYIPPSVIKQFQKETGIKVNYSTFDSNEALFAKLKINPNAGYDVIFPSTYFVERMIKQHMLQPLDKSKLPNLKNLDPILLDKPYDPNNQYTLPYLWSTAGILINTKYHKRDEIQSWQDLWKPKYRNQLLIMDDVRDTFAIAMKAAGIPIATNDHADIQHAYDKLKALLPNIRLFSTDLAQNTFVDEDITIAVVNSGDAKMTQDELPTLAYIIPREGPVIWIDSMAIPSGAANIDNAHKFIDFILRPDIALQISEKLGYSTPNLAARKLMPEELRNNRIINPSPADLKYAEYENDVDPATNDLYLKLWTRLKLGG